MAVTTTVPDFTVVPNSGNPSTLDSDTNSFLGELGDFITDNNSVGGEMNTLETNVTSLESSANTHQQTAEGYKDSAELSESQAQAAINATAYSSSTTYNPPTSVIATNGHVYRCIGTDVLDSEPSANPLDWYDIGVPDELNGNDKTITMRTTEPTVNGELAVVSGQVVFRTNDKNQKVNNKNFSFTADQNVTAGDPAGILASGNATDMMTVTSQATTALANSGNFGTYGVAEISCRPYGAVLDDDTTVFAMGYSRTLQVLCVKKSGTTLVENFYATYANRTGNYDAVPMIYIPSQGKVVIVGGDDAGFDSYVLVFDYDGTNLTFDFEYMFRNGASSSDQMFNETYGINANIISINDNNEFAVLIHNGDNTKLYKLTLDYVGNSASYSNESNIGDGTGYEGGGMIKVSDTKALVEYLSAGNFYSAILELSDFTRTTTSFADSGSAGIPRTGFVHSSGYILKQWASSDSESTIRIHSYSLSGNTLTTEQSFTTTSATTYTNFKSDMVELANGKVLLNLDGEYKILLVNSSTGAITVDKTVSSVDFLTKATLVLHDDGHFTAVQYNETDTDYYTWNLWFDYENEILTTDEQLPTQHTYLGFFDETITSGNPVNVTLANETADCFTGLTVATEYYYNELTKTVTTNSADIYIGVAINTTTLLLNGEQI